MKAEMKNDVVTDEYGNEWEYYTDDACGHVAVQRETADGYQAGQFVPTQGELYPSAEGSTFGVNSTDEYIVRGGQWTEND